MKSTQERIKNIERKLESETQRKKKRKTGIFITLGSCAAALVLALSLVLFLPLPVEDLTAKYQNSEYYALICKLDEFRPRGRTYKNNFEKLIASMEKKGDSNMGAAGDVIVPTPDAPSIEPDWSGSFDNNVTAKPDSPSDEGSGNGMPADKDDKYEETTNNQVDGVIEGDLIKRSSTTIYYLTTKHGYLNLDVYPIAGLNTKKTASLTLSAEENTSFSSYVNRREFYLSEDATRALVIVPCYHTEDKILYTALIGIDLGGETPVETGRVYVSGSYVSSRLVKGQLLLVSNFRVNKYDYSDEAQYIPQTGTLDSLKSVPMDAIVIPEETGSTRYTVLSAIDFDTLEVDGTTALMSYSNEVYVSQNNVFTTLPYRVLRTNGNAEELPGDVSDSDRWENRTKISCISYGQGLNLLGSVDVNGSLYDRFSMDEYENVLRVFTTTRQSDNKHYIVTTNASLYCYSLSDFSLIASKENFAPSGEQVFGARFRGKTAYVCTAREFTDPVFEFDLSDYSNITCTNTGTILGYSLYLMPFMNDTMVGIGYGDSRSTLKIELYEQGENEVNSVDKVEIKNVAFASNFKSYCVDKKNGLIGLAVSDLRSDKRVYVLYRFDGYQLVNVAELPLEQENFSDRWFSGYTAEEVRGIAIDNVFYLFTPASGLITVEL